MPEKWERGDCPQGSNGLKSEYGYVQGGLWRPWADKFFDSRRIKLQSISFWPQRAGDPVMFCGDGFIRRKANCTWRTTMVDICGQIKRKLSSEPSCAKWLLLAKIIRKGC